MPSTKEIFFKNLAQTSPFPLGFEVERAEGVYIITPEGKKIIDLISGIAVSNVGHSHPEVVKAVQDQAAKHMHLMVYGELVQAPQTRFAEALCANLPAQLNSVYFVNSGSEAVEGALKLARRYTGRTEFASLKRAYHGSTTGALALMGDDRLRQPFSPLLGEVTRLDPGNIEQVDQITKRHAAVFIEPIMGEAGAQPLSHTYLTALRNRCDQTGTLLVFDEIQCGMGRTGTLFAFEQCGLAPDILLLAKGLGGGMPIGAFIANSLVMRCLSESPMLGHITTFGGHPVCCAAGLAALDVVLNQHLTERAIQLGEIFTNRLKDVPNAHVRGMGAMLALELGSAQRVQQAIAKALDLGLLTDWFLFCDTALRIAPPLVMTNAEAHLACDILLKSLDFTPD